MEARQELSVGVIGCGYWGPNLIRNFSSTRGWRVKYICDLDPKRLAVMQEQYPWVIPVTNAQVLFDDKDLDAIAIATPVSSHANLAIAALESGKHVLVEKPLASSVEEAAHIVEVAEKVGRVLLVDHTFIYTPAVQKIKQLVESGELGDLLYFDSVRINLGLFQHDINVIWDLAPHDFSIMDYLFPDKPVAASASGMCHFGSQEDVAYVTAFFERNIIAHFHVNWLSPVKIRLILIGGSRKMVVYDDMENSEKVKVYDRGVEVIDSIGGIYSLLVQYRMGDMYSPKLDTKEALRTEVEHFRDCILTNKRPITDGQMGLRVVRLLEAAQRSLQSAGQRVAVLHPEK
ncbi:MAG: Gfo/Idh/MocA family oxidoreductase [Candidatus Sumerlaeaceae bacterium]|nr:Gfo/Idh/MocA family oxidoreductase [Candidatus Sumerlaeaceae bacterium]